jgi:transcriptional regulator with XRE-family HTH domain
MQHALWKTVAMPNIQESVKEWQLGMAGRFGAAVKAARKSLGLTAQQLSARTAESGYPITRVTISKIESNSRSGKVDVAEVLALAKALGVPPVMLLFGDLPDGDVAVLPESRIPTLDALRWFSGDIVEGDSKTAPNRLLRLTRDRVHKQSHYNAIRALADITETERDEREQRSMFTSLAQILYEIKQLNAEMATIPGAVVRTEEGATA